MSRVFDFNGIQDPSKVPAGWYQEKNSPNSQASLLIGSSNHNISGIMRFNGSEFQGFNGDQWVTFNSTKGDKGDKGTDFNSIVKLLNVGNGNGKLFPSNILDVNSEPTLRCRTLISGETKINNTVINTLNIDTVDNTVILTPIPQPMTWNCTNINKMITNNGSLCAYGDVSIWKVLPNTKVYRGQAVRITGDAGQYIEPLTYQMPINPFKKNLSFLGIALEDGDGDGDGDGDDSCDLNNIKVCTRGITAIKLSETIPKEFINSVELRDCGLPGIIAPDGFIFNSPVKPMGEYIQAGVFLIQGDIKKYADNNDGFIRFKI